LEHAPNIVTAVPKRRYRIGEFNAVILGELECRDVGDYVYVLALIRDGESEPALYVALEQAAPGTFEMRVTVAGDSRSYAARPSMRDLDEFAAVALDAAVQLFRLQDDSPYRMM
jgi:hypothetical protein